MMTGPEYQVGMADRHFDERGYFKEVGRGQFRQMNLSNSKPGVLRGLHYADYGKLVLCAKGRIFDVAIDCRLNTASLGSVYTATLEAGCVDQVYVPPHFAHGFLALEDSVIVYAQEKEWFKDDIVLHFEAMGVNWPTNPLVVSDKDKLGLKWADFISVLKSRAWWDNFPRIKNDILGFISSFFKRHPEFCGPKTYDEVMPTFLKEFREWEITWTGSTTSAV